MQKRFQRPLILTFRLTETRGDESLGLQACKLAVAAGFLPESVTFDGLMARFQIQSSGLEHMFSKRKLVRMETRVSEVGLSAIRPAA